MYCLHCGKELPTEAVFCPYCGKNQAEQIAIDHWEYCRTICNRKEPGFSLFAHENIRFCAIQDNESGYKTIAHSKDMRTGVSDLFEPNIKNARHKKAFDQLIEDLSQTGWYPMEPNQEKWYEIKLRRKLKT